MIETMITAAITGLFMGVFAWLYRKFFSKKKETESSDHQSQPSNSNPVQRPAPANTKVNDYMLIGCAVVGSICLILYFLTK